MLRQRRLTVRRQHKVKRYKKQRLKDMKPSRKLLVRIQYLKYLLGGGRPIKYPQYPFKIHRLWKGDLDNCGVLVLSTHTPHVLTVTLDWNWPVGLNSAVSKRLDLQTFCGKSIARESREQQPNTPREHCGGSEPSTAHSVGRDLRTMR